MNVLTRLSEVLDGEFGANSRRNPDSDIDGYESHAHRIVHEWRQIRNSGRRGSSR